MKNLALVMVVLAAVQLVMNIVAIVLPEYIVGQVPAYVKVAFAFCFVLFLYLAHDSGCIKKKNTLNIFQKLK